MNNLANANSHMTSLLSQWQSPPPPKPEWLPKCAPCMTFDPSLPSIPTPPVPEELQDRVKHLYGCKITDADIARYMEEEHVQNVPEDAYSRRRYKFALLGKIADDLNMGLMTQFHKRAPERPHSGPDEDMIYWAYGSFGR